MTEWYEWRDAPPGQYAVLGDPVSHSLSPRLHTWTGRASGHEQPYNAIRVPAGELGSALLHLKERGYLGVNCTVPLKKEAWLQSRSWPPFAGRVDGVNCLKLRDFSSTNTDVHGFMAMLAEHNISGRILVLGSGATARTVVYALTRMGHLASVWARRPEAIDFARVEVLHRPSTSGFSVVINATSAGHAGLAVPVEWEGEGLALDVNYGAPAQPFLASARAAGWRAYDGLPMLVHQAVEARRFWGIDAPSDLGAMLCAVMPVGEGPGWSIAVEGVKRGEVVVMPTETVLGLAADALNQAAVERIFAIKGRPATNPLIVHVADKEAAKQLVREWPPVADQLAKQFWPGPLTMVLPKANSVPAITTGGLDTVAVRVPSHPVAQKFLRDTGRCLAAPSANLSGELSPTRVEHLNPLVREQVWAVLEGEASEIGIESTVVRVSAKELVILRPGHITAEQLRSATGLPVRYAVGAEDQASPGHMLRHYAPRARVHLVEQLDGRTPAIEVGDQTPDDYARLLYTRLHELDAGGEPEVWIELPPDTEEWRAVRDRLNRMVG
jgi:L-threonylcarbamoyladenylate synthase